MAKKNKKNTTVTKRKLDSHIKEIQTFAQFDLERFYAENKETVFKFLKTDTFSMHVEDWDWDNVPESWWYKNKEGILRHGIKKSEKTFTALQKLEWIKCSIDVVYFTKKYIKIISIDDGIIPFALYPYQEDLLALYQDNRFVLSMQARQSGKTQTTAAFIDHFAIFNGAKTIAILANKADQAQEIIERIQLSYEMLPLFLQAGVKVYNKRTVVFGNNSKVFSAASSSSSIRGKSISLLYIDEAAFLPNDMQFYESTYPTIASGKKSRIIISSTPNGTRGMFYKLWQESVNEVNSFVNKLVTWDMVPNRDMEWKLETIANTSEEQFRQEHECVFRGSVDSLLSGKVLESIPLRTPIEVIDNSLKVYHEPVKDRMDEQNKTVEEGHVYVILADCSEGVGKDYHAITVVDITTKPYEVAAVYRNNTLSTLVLPQLIQNIGMKYNNAFVLIEAESTGSQVASDLYYDLEYENVLMTIAEKNKQVIGFSSSARLGVKQSKAVKALGCSTIKTLIEKDKIRLNDIDIIAEFGTFVPKGGSYAAAEGATDDLAMTMVLFGWLVNQSYFIEMTSMKVKDLIVGEMTMNDSEKIMPFGIISSGDYEFDGEEFIDEDEAVTWYQ